MLQAVATCRIDMFPLCWRSQPSKFPHSHGLKLRQWHLQQLGGKVSLCYMVCIVPKQAKKMKFHKRPARQMGRWGAQMFEGRSAISFILATTTRYWKGKSWLNHDSTAPCLRLHSTPRQGLRKTIALVAKWARPTFAILHLKPIIWYSICGQFFKGTATYCNSSSDANAHNSIWLLLHSLVDFFAALFIFCSHSPSKNWGENSWSGSPRSRKGWAQLHNLFPDVFAILTNDMPVRFLVNQKENWHSVRVHTYNLYTHRKCISKIYL